MAERNPLASFATFNCLWRFGCASVGELNSGSYRQPLAKPIISTGGRDPNRVQTAWGAPEYSMDNVVINGIIVPSPAIGSGPFVKMEFEVYEPYSMGLFLESMQAAALEKGYISYADNAAFIVQLEFVGRYDDGSVGTLGPYSWCVRMKNVTFTVNEAGSVYKCEAFPYGLSAMSDQLNTTFTDVQLQGKTTNEILIDHPEKSLKAFLNNREKQLVKDEKKGLPDVYDIVFVDDNPYGRGPGNDLEFRPESQGGTEVVKSEKQTYDDSGKVIRAKMAINPKEKSLLFSQETSITNIINQVLLQSKEAKDNVTKPNKIDGEGKITWWKIFPDLKLGDFDPKIKDYQKIITYRITPYKMHHTAYLSANAGAQGVAALKSSAQRIYNYIYTGKNLDILKFNIEIKNMFFQAVDPNKAERNAAVTNQGPNASVASERTASRAPVGAAGPSVGGTSTRTALDNTAGNRQIKGGAGDLSTEQKIANEFYKAYLNSVANQYNLDLEILGDPYWLPELGQTGYHGGGNSPVGGNNTMNYQGTEIYTVVNFRTPADPDAGGAAAAEPGGYFFPYQGNHPFSGVFRVNKVESKFKGNLFSQTLTGIRLPAQDVESGGEPFPTMIRERPLQDTGTHISQPGD